MRVLFFVLLVACGGVGPTPRILESCTPVGSWSVHDSLEGDAGCSGDAVSVSDVVDVGVDGGAVTWSERTSGLVLTGPFDADTCTAEVALYRNVTTPDGLVEWSLSRTVTFADGGLRGTTRTSLELYPAALGPPCSSSYATTGALEP